MLPLTGGGIVYARPHAGVEITANSVMSVSPYNPPFTTPYPSIYENLDNGILADGSNLHVRNSTFINCEYGIYSSGWGSSLEDLRNTYVSSTNGIFSRAADFLSVNKTFMYNIQSIGLNITQSDYAEIKNNQIE